MAPRGNRLLWSVLGAFVAVVMVFFVQLASNEVRRYHWLRECERRVPAYDENTMDACKEYGPGVLPAGSYVRG